MTPGGRPPETRVRVIDLLWPPLIWRPKDPEMRAWWGPLRMNTLNVWLLVSLGLSVSLLWPIITIVRQGYVDTFSLVIGAVAMGAQVLPVYGVKRWRDHARRVLQKRKGSDLRS
jgi:hypothetical protein